MTSPVPSPLSVLPNERSLFHPCAWLGCRCLQQDSLPVCLFIPVSMEGTAYRKHALCVAGGVPGPQTSATACSPQAMPSQACQLQGFESLIFKM